MMRIFTLLKSVPVTRTPLNNCTKPTDCTIYDHVSLNDATNNVASFSFKYTPGTITTKLHAMGLLTKTLRGKFFAFAMTMLGLFFVSSALGQATVTTDQLDYPPGSIVYITGSGFAPGENVTLQVLHVGDGDDTTSPSGAHAPWTVVTDSLGNVSSTWIVPFDEDELGATLLLTADGETSLVHAEITFTDANPNKVASVTISASQTGTITYGTSSNATYTVTIIPDGGSDPSSTNLSLNGTLPSGATFSFSTPNPITLPGGSTTPIIVTLTITNSVSTNAGTTSGLSVSASNSPTRTSGTTTYVINKRPITVTAQTNSKIYDASTSAAAVPTITSGTLVGGQTTSFIETYDSKNVGTGKTLTPSGTVNDGNSGNNYAYTFVTNTTGVISVRSLTITAATNTKTYDATTSAAATPTITSGTLQGTDVANFTETYDTKNVGIGKILTPSGTVNDGNSGNNYTYTFTNSTNGTINARALTVTASTNTKTYDATTSASATPTIISGVLQGTDVANFSEVYANTNAGISKTLIPSGTVTDGNSGNNYTYTFVNSTNGTINARALTITAATNTKTYDATTSAAATPLITLGVLQGTDVANFTEVYNNKNVGTGKTLTPSGTVTDGNSGNNYSYTFVNNTSGVINARALTVTAQTNTKTYDATTSAATTPLITSGVIQGTDVTNFTESYDNKNAGSGKTLTPSGTVTDGNSGNNYTYTFVNDITGIINARALTVTAAANTKTYDGTTSTVATPAITSGTLQGSDAANFTEAYDTKNAGTGKTLTAAGIVADGNSGNNYTYNFVNNTTGIINARALTVTATASSKTYDGTTSSPSSPTITGAIQTGDVATFIEVYDDKNAGTGKTLIPSGLVNDGNGGANYTYTFVNYTSNPASSRQILPLALTITAQTNTKTYDGATSAAAIPSITSGIIQTGDVANFTEAYNNKNAGTGKTLIPSGTITDGNSGNNYTYNFVNNTTGVINVQALTITANTNTKLYDGTTSAAATPTVTSGTVYAGDVASFTETYDNKNAGSGKTLTASGTVNDGNGGSNYSYSFADDNTGVINARTLTVTAITNTKTYDASTNAAAIPAITGIIQSGDVAAFTETYDTRNAGTGKTLTPGGTVNDGNSGNNYTYTFVNNTTGVINTRTLTVTAAANTKTYDANTIAAAIPTITSGVLQGVDAANFTEVYVNINVGTGKTLIPSGSVTDGNSGNNYSITFVNNTTGVINARALTVTAQTNAKTYDANTSADATPTITSGVLQGTDVANFTEVYNNKNAGTGKTLIPGGNITDGNNGNNYSYTFINDNTGVINARSLTITAQTNTKTYDGTSSAAAIPSITSGVVQGADVANFTEAYNNKNAGTGKTLTPGGNVTDGNNGNNYTYTFVNDVTGVINARVLTITAQTNTKTYDGTTSAAATPTITGTIQPGDAANFTETYDTKNAGTNKTLMPSGTVTDGNSGNNYTYTFVNNTTGVINARALTIAGAPSSKVYDGTTSSPSIPAITGVIQTGDVANFIQVYDNKNAGTGKTLIPSGSVNDGNGGNNYTYTFNNLSTGPNRQITSLAITITAATNTKVYDGTTSAVAIPTVTSGAIQIGDVANFTEVYSDKNAGTGKTLIPSGTVTDGNSGNNYNYTFINNTTGVINKRAITVTASANTKTYDGNTTAAALPTIINGTLAAGDAAVFSETYNNKNQGSGKTMVPAIVSIVDGLSANMAGNYDVTLTNSNDGVINKLLLTINAPTLIKTKTYDGNTTAAVTAGTLQNVVGTETVTVSAAANYDTKDQGNGKTITTVYTIGGADAGNYDKPVDFIVNDGVINKLLLTISAPTLTKIKTYDGNTTAAVTAGTLQNVVGAETVTVSAASNYDTKDQGNGKTITTVYTIGGADAGNYDKPVDFIVNDGVINKLLLTINAPTLIKTKTYDGNTTAAVTAGTLQNVVGTETVTVSAAANYDTKDQGNGKTITTVYTISGADAGNYDKPADYVVHDGVINKKALTATSTIASKIYDGSAVTGTVSLGTVSGYVDSETLVITPSAADYSNANAEIGKASTISYGLANGANGGLTSNYSMANLVTTGDITARPLNITGTKVYDATTTFTAAQLTPANIVSGDIVNVSGSATVSSKNVGAYTSFATNSLVSSNANYKVTGGTVNVSITVATLTYNANAVSKTYGNVNPGFSGTITGFAGTDSQANATTGTMVFSTTATQFSNVGSYAITGSGLTANFGNYIFAQAADNVTAFTINCRPLNFTGTKVFNSSATFNASQLVASNIVNSDIVTLGGSATVSSDAVGPYTSFLTNSLTSSNSNYKVMGGTVNVTITAAATSITVAPISVQYSDQATFVATITSSTAQAELNGTGGTVSFKIQLNSGGPVIDLGTSSYPADWSIVAGLATVTKAFTILQAPGTYKVIICFTPISTNLIGVTNSNAGPLTVTKEDAVTDYTGPMAVATSSTTSSSAIITMTATIRDITAVTGNPLTDIYPGDIRNAKVRFFVDGILVTNSNSANGAITDGNGWTSPGLVNSGDLKTGTVLLKKSVDIGSNDAYPYTIRVEVGDPGYYQAENEEVVVTVYKPLNDFITGGGYIIPTRSNGTYKSDAGRKTNFGFNVRYNKTGKNLQGNINTIFRRLEGSIVHTYQIKGNAMTSLSVIAANANPASNTNPKKALFNGKANMTDITNPLAPISLGGNLTLQVSMTDRGEPGLNDQIGIMVYDNAGGILYSSDWDGIKTGELYLTGGNIVVTNSSVSSGTTQVGDTREIDITPAAESNLRLKAYPNPTQHYFTLNVDGNNNEDVEIRVFSLSSKQIYTTKGSANRIYRFGDNFINGVYIVEVTQGDKHKTIKLIKQQ